MDNTMLVGAPTAFTAFLSLVLWANSGGATYAFEAFRDWLREAGFRRVEQHSERWLSALKWAMQAAPQNASRQS